VTKTNLFQGSLEVKSDWWKSEGGFFGKKYAEADNSLEGFLKNPQVMNARVTQEVSGVIKLCNLKKGDKILDAPCGYGRHSLGLALRGFGVTGVDINKEHLGIGRKSLKKLKLVNADFYRRDIRKLNFKNKYDAVINMFYSFGFFDDFIDDMKTLENFYRVLRKGGKFLMHTFITLPKIENGDYKKRDIRTLVTGNKLELFREYDYKTKREFGEWSLVTKNGKKHKLAPYSMRIYTDIEYIGMCTKVGFSKIDVYGGWKGEKYKDSSELMIVVATK